MTIGISTADTSTSMRMMDGGKQTKLRTLMTMRVQSNFRLTHPSVQEHDVELLLQTFLILEVTFPIVLLTVMTVLLTVSCTYVPASGKPTGGDGL
jgi:hypothetical protein